VSLWARAGLGLLLLGALLLVLARQGEATSRTDFLWQHKLRLEQDEVETMRGINKVMTLLVLGAVPETKHLHTCLMLGGE
jgi:hypothetical protein